jgi:hypothetical protein
MRGIEVDQIIHTLRADRARSREGPKNIHGSVNNAGAGVSDKPHTKVAVDRVYGGL